MPQVPGNLEQELPPATRVQATNAPAQVAGMYDQPLAEAQQISQEEADRANQAKATDAYSKLVNLKNQITYGQDGFTTKFGEDAFNLKAQYMPKWQDAVKGVTENLTGAQKNLLLPALKNEEKELDGAMLIHEHQQRQGYYESAANGTIDALRNDAISNYQAAPDKLDLSLQSQYAEVKKLQGLKGWSDEEAMTEARKAYDNTVAGVMENLLKSGNYKQAQKLFDEKGNDLTPATQDKVYPALRDGMLTSRASEMEGQFNGRYALPGGNVNLNKIDNDVQAMGDLSDEEKLKLQDQVKGIARSHIIGNQQRRQGQDEAFEKSLLMAQQNKMSLTDFQKQIDGMGGDYLQTAKWKSLANRMWKGGMDNVDNKAVVNGLLGDIISGKGDPRAELEAAYNNGQGQISAKTYMDLSKKVNELVVHGPNNDQQGAWKSLSGLAEQHFGKNSPDIQDFLYDIYTHSGGKTGTDLVKYAQDELKNIPKNDFKAWSAVNDFNAIHQKSLVNTGWFGPSFEDKRSFAAVKYLQKIGAPVTPENIDATLKKNANGELY